MQKDNHMLKMGFLFLILIVVSQSMVYLLGLNWHLLPIENTLMNGYYADAYLANLQIRLWLSYGLALGIFGFQLLRTWGLKSYGVIEKAVKLHSVNKGHKVVIIISAFLFIAYMFYVVRLDDIVVALLELLGNLLTNLAPFFILLDSKLYFYEKYFRYRGRIYQDIELSDIVEGDCIDTEMASVSFMHYNRRYRFELPLEHANLLREQFKRYLSSAEEHSSSSPLKWANRP